MRAGEAAAEDGLFAAAYGDLRRLAHARLRVGGRNTLLQTTSLVHEAYLRLARSADLRSQDRGAFFAYASKVMRSIIVNSAEQRLARKRGGHVEGVPWSTQIEAEVAGGNVAEGEQIVLRVHEALGVLEDADPRLAQVAQMRYFGGFEDKEIAQSLGVSVRTVRRDWEKARVLLIAAMQ
ncbi:MAG: sigma-70 family RNA polymerase sigma factor [Burkholderiaceae bacterium]|nr:sigma-70 family RNA polymerase sigma factor [Burkholderiaceae bacterium]